MRVLDLPAIPEEVAHALDFISNSLEEFGVSDKKTVQAAMLATEESLVKLLENVISGQEMEIGVKKSFLGAVIVSLEVPGRAFNFYKDMGWHDSDELTDADSPDIENALRGTILTSIDGDVVYDNKKGINIVHIVIKKD